MSAWTPAMVARLQGAAPLNYSKAQDMASELGVTTRSVIAKAVSLGIEYVKAEKAKKRTSETKAQMVERLESQMNQSLEGMGFDKINASGLAFLLAYSAKQDAE